MSNPMIAQIIPITNKQVKDIAGQRFGRLFVLGYIGSVAVGQQGQRRTQWLCRCDCGNLKTATAASLKAGFTRSCGCLSDEIRHQPDDEKCMHGMSGTSEFKAWQSMRQRCENPRAQQFENYGARGIKVCERWQSFENFIADIGPRPSKSHSIDRIDNDGDYCPENCRWGTSHQQQNNRRNNRLLTYRQETHTIAEWAKLRHMNYRKLWERIKRHWSPREALEF